MVSARARCILGAEARVARRSLARFESVPRRAPGGREGRVYWLGRRPELIFARPGLDRCQSVFERTNLDRCRPNSAALGQLGVVFGQVWCSTKFGPCSTNFAPKSARFGPSRPTLDRFRPDVGRLDQSGPTSTKLRPSSNKSMQADFGESAPISCQLRPTLDRCRRIDRVGTNCDQVLSILAKFGRSWPGLDHVRLMLAKLDMSWAKRGDDPLGSRQPMGSPQPRLPHAMRAP